MKPAQLQAFYVLHSRAYRETSLLLECLTQDEGYITLVAKGIKRPRSDKQYILQAFIPLLGSWSHHGELGRLANVEAATKKATFLQGETLFRALYINELLIKVLHRHDPHPVIFDAYQHLLMQSFSEADLRRFEKILLTELGYGFNFEYEAETKEAIKADKKYYFYLDRGFIGVKADIAENDDLTIFEGKHLLAIARDEYHSSLVLNEAKQLMRLALQALLNGKNLKSQEFYQLLS